MSYTALYRKWRPDQFGDVKGQEAIVTTLKNQIKADRIGHAYLFCGTRGTGKTTVAKIFAKAVNCENPVDGDPCGKCPTCIAIAQGASMNVIEIDAASNNGVEDIRQIREEVQYSPTSGRFKVYIIDEVHMLSIGAFNALLKTLEEPPSYVIFILATTETHKIPITILSRCQRYDFKRISIDTIASRLKELTQAENVLVEDKALKYVAKAADGSMRDALSLLDQCIAFYLGKELKYDNVLEVLGAVDTEVFSRLIRMIVGNDTLGCIKLLDEIVMQGRDLGQFVTDFTWYLRNLLLIKTSDDASDAIDMSTDNLELLKEESKMIDDDSIMRFIRIFSELSNEVKYSTQKRVLVEIAIIKLTKPAMEQRKDFGDILSRLSMLEKRMDEGIVVTKEEKNTVPVVNNVEKDNEPKKEATREDLERIVASWSSFITKKSEDLMWVRTVLSGSIARISPEGDGIIIYVSSDMGYNFVTHDDSRTKEIESLIEDEFGVHASVSEFVCDNKNVGDEFSRMSTIENMINVNITVDDSKEDI